MLCVMLNVKLCVMLHVMIWVCDVGFDGVSGEECEMIDFKLFGGFGNGQTDG